MKSQDKIKIEKLQQELKEIKKNQSQNNSFKSSNLPIIITSIIVVSLTTLLVFTYFMSDRYINLKKQIQQQTNTSKPQNNNPTMPLPKPSQPQQAPSQKTPSQPQRTPPISLPPVPQVTPPPSYTPTPRPNPFPEQPKSYTCTTLPNGQIQCNQSL